MTVAAKVCLGLELALIRREVRQKTKPGPRPDNYGHNVPTIPSDAIYPAGLIALPDHEADPNSWDDACQKYLGIPKRTADKFIAAGEAARNKIKKLGWTHAIELIETPTHLLNNDQIEQLRTAIQNATTGESLSSLLAEFRVVSVPPPAPTIEMASMGGSAPRIAASEEQLALNFSGAGVVAQLAEIRRSERWLMSLHQLPLSSSDSCRMGLIDYVDELRKTYEHAEEVLHARSAN